MTKKPKHTGLADEVRKIIAAATDAGVMLTSREIYAKCETAEGLNGVATTLHDLYKRGEIERKAQDDGRYAFRMATKGARAPVPAGPKAPVDVVTPKPAPVVPAPVDAVSMTPAPGPQQLRKVTLAKLESAEGLAPASESAGGVESMTYLGEAVITETHPAKKPFSYDLYDHLSSALGDLDDLAGDVLDRDAPRVVIRAVLAAQGSLRRAQEALIQAERAAR